MRLCSRTDLVSLEDGGHVAIQGASVASLMLDEHRIGLTLERIVELSEPVDLGGQKHPEAQVVDLADHTFRRGDFALGLTRERISLSNSVFGTLHTRSKFARLGLKMLTSANYVAPGSGWGSPTQLVFEMEFAVDIAGLVTDECYAFMLLYQLSADAPDDLAPTSLHAERFPLHGNAQPESTPK